MAHGVTAPSDSDLGDLGPFERALGPKFASLHPKIQEQYAIRPSDEFYWRGGGTMSVVRNGGWHVRPFASLGARRRILFAETGRDVPFIIENHAYVDSYGRATVTWLREFDFEIPRRFDEYVVYCEERKTAAVLAGTRQHLAVDLSLSVIEGGALHLRGGGQWVTAWGIRAPFPRLCSGDAVVTERYLEDRGCFEIDVRIQSPIVGTLFEYRGEFTLERVPNGRPELTRVRPRRENPRV